MSTSAAVPGLRHVRRATVTLAEAVAEGLMSAFRTRVRAARRARRKARRLRRKMARIISRATSMEASMVVRDPVVADHLRRWVVRSGYPCEVRTVGYCGGPEEAFAVVVTLRGQHAHD